jgi:ADP-ribose pyrophosphatase YjhB (NUDIX family)
VAHAPSATNPLSSPAARWRATLLVSWGVNWLAWAQRLQAICQTGLTYSQDPYDRERYEQLQDLAFEVLAEGTGAPAARVMDAFSLEKGYPTPKVDVRAAVFDGERLLFVRERSSGLWSLPGGWADVGDSASQVAVRETREETGLEVRAVKLVAALDKARHPHPPSLFYCYKLIFRCELLGGQPRPNHEIFEVAFFGRHELPPLDAERITAGQVERVFAHFDAPELPTEFD